MSVPVASDAGGSSSGFRRNSASRTSSWGWPSPVPPGSIVSPRRGLALGWKGVHTASRFRAPAAIRVRPPRRDDPRGARRRRARGGRDRRTPAQPSGRRNREAGRSGARGGGVFVRRPTARAAFLSEGPGAASARRWVVSPLEAELQLEATGLRLGRDDRSSRRHHRARQGGAGRRGRPRDLGMGLAHEMLEGRCRRVGDQIDGEREGPHEQRQPEEGAGDARAALPTPQAAALEPFFRGFVLLGHRLDRHGFPRARHVATPGRSLGRVSGKSGRGRSRVREKAARTSACARVAPGLRAQRPCSVFRSGGAAADASGRVEPRSAERSRVHLVGMDGECDAIAGAQPARQASTGQEVRRETALVDAQGDDARESIGNEASTDALPIGSPSPRPTSSFRCSGRMPTHARSLGSSGSRSAPRTRPRSRST